MNEELLLVKQAYKQLNTVVLGKERQVKLALCGLFAQGHMLIEDLPGMGKTTLAQSLGLVLGLDYKRIQFTSDLLPSDVLGATIFDPNTSEFTFHPGPVFSQLLLADELNRATPKSQSALLEAMEEGQVSIDGHPHKLPEPFFVIATQNPQSQTGTFPLPESQLDRFLMRISMGYPDPSYEMELLRGTSGREAMKTLTAVMDQQQLQAIQTLIPGINTSEALLDYIHRLVLITRQHEDCQLGLSPRGAIALVRASQAWAFISGRQQVLPEDVQAVFVPVSGHRILGRQEKQGDVLARKLLAQVDVIGKKSG